MIRRAATPAGGVRSKLRTGSIVLVLVLVLAPACSRHREASSDWVTRAEVAHREADQRLPRGDVAGARAALRQAAEAPAPATANPLDARAVRQDLYCRLASLEAEHGEASEAVRWATKGLELGRGEDAFTANLEIVRARALERLGDPNGASRDYHDALVVTEKLLEQHLGRPGTSHD